MRATGGVLPMRATGGVLPMLCRVMGGRLIGRPGRSSSAVGKRTSEAESSSRVDSSSWR